jgi:hypothetical protein
MYSVNWYDRHQQFMVIGAWESVLEILGYLESAGIPFKVANCQGFQVDQGPMGCGDFICWLPPEAAFQETYPERRRRKPRRVARGLVGGVGEGG